MDKKELLSKLEVIHVTLDTGHLETAKVMVEWLKQIIEGESDER